MCRERERERERDGSEREIDKMREENCTSLLRGMWRRVIWIYKLAAIEIERELRRQTK
jgi:hypothetical protein